VRSISRSRHECMEGQIVKNLWKTENLRVKCELINLQTRCVQITEET